MRGFRTFVLRGNVVDLAIAVVIGVAFTAVVTAFVKDMVTPLIAALGGKPDFASLYFTINKSKFLYGDFINAVVSFVIIAAVIYFFVVVPYTAMLARSKKEPSPDPTTKKCTECLSEIPKDARRCAFCTSPQPI
ncbi:MAG: large conductance mechanosensitive channel protein MscL [Chloroflexi bacterium]|nr:MAG: large conductance mechanosensitive channel protein MscL [Chloroflexota bacterium]